MLSTQQPAFLLWGSQHIRRYNDAFIRPSGPENQPPALLPHRGDCFAGICGVIGTSASFDLDFYNLMKSGQRDRLDTVNRARPPRPGCGAEHRPRGGGAVQRRAHWRAGAAQVLSAAGMKSARRSRTRARRVAMEGMKAGLHASANAAGARQ